MSVQLYAYDDSGVRHEINLYDEEPIKITISAENIQDVVQVDSSYSRAFRIPGNQNNSALFSWWYEVNTVDFDITQKRIAEIYVDGLLYRKGHIRVEAAYLNGDTDNVELEVVFYGETKDFSTQVGEGFLDGLDTSDVNHGYDLAALQASWLPRTDPGVLVGGVVRYILADRGYTYDETGAILQDSEIAFDNLGTAHNKGFYKNSHPLPLNQFTPIVQTKYLIDKIFAETDYSYSADSVFNEDWFKELYTDGLPSASPFIEQYNSDIEYNIPFPLNFVQNTERVIPYQRLVSDPSFSYNRTQGIYTAQADDTSITITASLSYAVSLQLPVANATFEMFLKKNGNPVPIATYSNTNFGGVSGLATISWTGPVTAGDTFRISAKASSVWPISIAVASSGTLEVNGTATSMKVNRLLKPDVKKIDFLKSILTKFRLVMVPSKYDDKTFIIKPWVNYIGSGDQFDWTHKLDETKDTILQPLFYDQAATVVFQDQVDEDSVNQFYFNSNDYVYGRLIFDSENDLLQGTNTITTIFAPTPVDQAEGAVDDSNFIIPFFSRHGDDFSDHGHIQHLPIKVRPRLLFWNGLTAIDATEGWHYTDGATTVHNTTDYPRATDVSVLPTTATTLNLNWFKEYAFYDIDRTPEIGLLGESVYTRYWDYYIRSLYSPSARKMTAYFTIDSQDLKDLTFDDAIFIKNSWWRVLKIYDAPLTDIATVKVDLIKLLEFPGSQSGIIGDGVYGDSGQDWGPTSGTSGGNWGGSSSGTSGTGGSTSGSSGLDTRYYELYDCSGEGLPIIASFTGSVQPTIGYVCNVAGAPYAEKCYTIVRMVQGPAVTTILQTFATCAECQL